MVPPHGIEPCSVVYKTTASPQCFGGSRRGTHHSSEKQKPALTSPLSRFRHRIPAIDLSFVFMGLHSCFLYEHGKKFTMRINDLNSSPPRCRADAAPSNPHQRRLGADEDAGEGDSARAGGFTWEGNRDSLDVPGKILDHTEFAARRGEHELILVQHEPADRRPDRQHERCDRPSGTARDSLSAPQCQAADGVPRGLLSGRAIRPLCDTLISYCAVGHGQEGGAAVKRVEPGQPRMIAMHHIPRIDAGRAGSSHTRCAAGCVRPRCRVSAADRSSR